MYIYLHIYIHSIYILQHRTVFFPPAPFRAAKSTATIMLSALIMGIEAEIWNPNSGDPKPAQGASVGLGGGDGMGLDGIGR